MRAQGIATASVGRFETGEMAASATAASRFAAPILMPRPEDRWRRAGLDRRRSATTMASILVASAMIHGAFVATAWFTTPSAPPPSQEIAVEVVPEEPKAPSTPPVKAETSAPPQPASKPVQTTAAPPAPKPTAPPPAAKPDEDQQRQLQDELAKLRAEQAALQAERQAMESDRASARNAQVKAAKPLPSFGLGSLPQSFQAVALPSETTGEGDVVGYAAIVFSELAKAKKAGDELGIPGTAGVRFSIDDQGALVRVELAVSSGVKALDDEAISIVRKAAPFPPPPKDAQRTFDANVSFVVGSRG